MTTEQPRATQSPRLLRRRASDRVIGGVAAGIADYLNVDPVLVRAVFVGLVVFGGAGLVLYLGAWLLIPVQGRDRSPLELALPRLGALPAILLALFAVAALFAVLDRMEYVSIDTPALLVLLLVVAGIYLLRRGGPAPSAPVAAASVSTDTPLAAPAAMTQPATGEPQPRPARSPLGWYTTAAALIGVGVAALLDNAGAAALLPGQYFGLTLAIVGGGLLIGSWWGRARSLLLPGLLVLLLGIPAGFLTVPLEGGIGGPYFAPTSASEIPTRYQLAFGKLTVDLTDLPVSTAPLAIEAAVGAGGLQVIVPEDVQVQVETEIGAGGSWVLGDAEGGTDLANFYTHGDFGRLIVLDLAVGIGSIEVDQRTRLADGLDYYEVLP
ncbi:MAG TPA: PspC domain-containing protein [Candidatus Limnocylindria bacterium]|nr:PspC domain-containing protein [Candidatus Limnocylindria bacterium]